MKHSYDKYYKDVSKRYVNQLKDFRTMHPEKKLIIDEVEWQYIECGNGRETLLLLAGGMGVGEAFFRHIMELEQDYKVIVPTFPAVETIHELVSGIRAIMKNEGISRYYVLGQSFGGILAQVLIQEVPQDIEKVILSHTTTSTEDMSQSVMDENVDKINKMIKLIKIIPMWLIRPLFKKKISKLLKVIEGEERKFWEAYFTERLDYKTKKQEVSVYQSMIDFAKNYKFTEEDFKNWKGTTLIVDSDTDTAFDQTQKKALKDLFPYAETYEFKGTGHLSIIAAREEYMKIVKAFLNGDYLLTYQDPSNSIKA